MPPTTEQSTLMPTTFQTTVEQTPGPCIDVFPEDIIILSEMMNADGLVVTYYVADNADSHLITTDDLQNVVLKNDEDMSSDFGYEMELFDSPVQPTVPSTVVAIPEQTTTTRIRGLTSDEFQAAEQLQFRINMAFYVNVHCSVQGTCDLWTVHPDDIPLQHMAAPYRHQKRHLLQEEEPVIVIDDDVIIWSIRDVVENSVDITFTIEVNGQPMNPDDVESTVETYNEEIVEDICTNCEIIIITPNQGVVNNSWAVWFLVLLIVVCLIILGIVVVFTIYYFKRRGRMTKGFDLEPIEEDAIRSPPNRENTFCFAKEWELGRRMMAIYDNPDNFRYESDSDEVQDDFR